MGIQGLLTFVKPASKSCHLSDLKGQTVAIDSYCWIHKGAFSCAEKLGKGEDTDAYVQYCFKFLDMLRTFKITPIMVFDGQNLPAKRLTEEKRRDGRALAKKRAVECLKLNKLGEARMNFVKAVDVTPEMALKLIKACRKQNIDCIVAPYEADAQLAFLNHSGIADFVITEDSDLLVFGCKKVLFKLDLYGNGTLVESEKLFLAMDEKPEAFTTEKFRHMCILSGCDYLESLPGIGLKKGLKFVKANSNCDIYDVLPKLPTTLNLKNVTVTKDYRDNFMTAEATFKHQLIFDPIKRQIRPLFDPLEHGTKLEFCSNAGDMMDQEIAYQLALGNLSPDDLKVMDSWNPDKDLSPYAFKPSIWSRSYKLQDRTKNQKIEPVILPKTKNKKVIIDVKISKPNSVLPSKEEIQEIEKREENLVKEIHALYFNAVENPAKKICFENTRKSEKTSPVLTRNRKNIFIKSRFFAEKSSTDDPNSGISSPKDEESPTTQNKLSGNQESQNESNKGPSSQNESKQDPSCQNGSSESQDLTNLEILNHPNVQGPPVSNKALNSSIKKVKSPIKTRNFVFKRKLGSMESPDNSEQLEESPISLKSLERRSSRTAIQKKLSLEVQNPLNDIDPEFSYRNIQESKSTPENLEEEVMERLERRSSRTVFQKSSVEVQNPLNDIDPEFSIRNLPDNTSTPEDVEEEVISSSQKENNVSKICRSRFFSVESQDDIVLCKKEVSFEETIEVKRTLAGSQGSKLFSKSKSLDDKLLNIDQKMTVSTKTTSSRRVGLSRKTSSSKFTIQKNQTKLSMFFDKKVTN